METPIINLKGVGPKLSEKLAKIGINAIKDLLLHLPSSYQDRTKITPFKQLSPNDFAVIKAEIKQVSVVYQGRRRLIVVLQQEAMSLHLVFFNFHQGMQQSFIAGKTIVAYGTVIFYGKTLAMVHPEYGFVDGEINLQQQTLTPHYPLTKGVSQAQLRKLINAAKAYIANIEELLPANIRKQQQLMPLSQAVAAVHEPPATADINLWNQMQHPAQQRIIFEEMLAHHLQLRQRRQMLQQADAVVLKFNDKIHQQFIESLGFNLTAAQKRVIAEIIDDLQKTQPMLRLVQGDVGAGKTIVAAAAALQALANGQQVAIMAPTEILAEQHWLKFKQWLQPFDFKCEMLSGKLTAKASRSVKENILLGLTNCVVGTHALFQEDVRFNNLALVIVDEQHRFGVKQRLALQNKGVDGELMPHQLMMSATPIPRTLAMAFYADLDVSTIDELPPGRTPIETVALAATRRNDVINKVAEICAAGRQVYWVCTLIEESENLDSAAAVNALAALRQQLPHLKISLIHGKCHPQEKEELMKQFKAGEIQVLVATTVIEVGVDVANATLMVIEDAHRLGLSQLHQLRGRVGRGDKKSYCVLLYKSPLSFEGKQRLEVLRQTTDGFKIAEKDLELRGPGEVFGTQQTGDINFGIANLVRDSYLIPQVQQAAKFLLQHDTTAADKIIERWLEAKMDFATV